MNKARQRVRSGRMREEGEGGWGGGKGKIAQQ